MQPREKKLALIVGVTVGFWLVYSTVNRLYFAPRKDRLEMIATTQDLLEVAELKEVKSIIAKGELREWNTNSLPPDPLTSQRLYQTWLNDLAQAAGFSSLKVSPGRRSPRERVYTSVAVNVDAEGSLQQLAWFLHEFHRTKLLHRISTMRLESQGADGEPLLTISIVAEGLSLAKSPPRDRLFPETSLVAAVKSGDKELTVAESKTLPTKPGFRLRIGNEFMMVTGINARRWTVQRGVDRTKAADHPEQAIVEMAPLRSGPRNIPFEEYEKRIVTQSPFVKPAPPKVYRPRLEGLAETTLYRGKELSARARASGFNPAFGEISYRLAEGAPAGMTIDPKTGEIKWKPGDEVKAGAWTGTVVARAGTTQEHEISGKLSITLRDINKPPLVEPIVPQTAWQGQEIKFKVLAQDPDDPAGKLSYKLSGSSLKGAEIDAKSGLFRWTPDETVAGGDYTVEIAVRDDGTPAETTTVKAKVTVKEDAARFTYLIGAVSVDDEWQALFYDRGSNTKRSLREGDLLDFADVRGPVVLITREFILYQTENETRRIDIGESVRSSHVFSAPTETSEPPGE